MLTILNIDLFLQIVRYLPLEDVISLCISNKKFYHYGTHEKYNNPWYLLMCKVYQHVYNYPKIINSMKEHNYVKFTKMITQIDVISQMMVQHRFDLHHVYAADRKLSKLDYLVERHIVQFMIGKPLPRNTPIYSDFSKLCNGEKLTVAELNILMTEMLNYRCFNGVEKLVELGADINSIYDYATYCFIHCDQTEYLLTKGIDIKRNDFKHFRAACKYGQLDTIKYLLTYQNNIFGIDVNIRNGYSLSKACRYGFKDIVDYLLDNGADIHISNEQALSMAAEGGHVNIIELLLSRGTDIHANNEKALRRAASQRNIDVMYYLIEQGADFRVPMVMDKIILKLSIGMNEIETDMLIDFLQFLLDKGAHIHGLDYCMFRRASQNGNLKLVKFLHEKGANIHSQNDYAIRWARKNNHQDVVDYISLLDD